MSGISPKNPRDYVGPNVFLVPTITRNRRPTDADYRQPETGKLYPISSVWQVGKDPTTGVEGEMWILTKIVANVASWVIFTGGTPPSGGILSIETDDGGPNVVPDGVGAVQILGGAGIDVTGQGPGNTVTVALTGGGAAIDEVKVDFATVPGVDPVVPDQTTGRITIIGNTVGNATNTAFPVATHTRALNAFNIDVQVAAAVAPTPVNSNNVGLASFNNTQFTTDINGFTSLIGGNLPVLQTLTGNTGGAVGPDGAGNIDFVGIGETTVAGTPGSNLLEIFSPRTAQFVVDPVADVGTHTTIQSAIDDAVSGEIIFVRPGVYTENLTLKAGVSLFSFRSVIVGKITANYAGTVRMTGFNFQTNGDYAIEQLAGSACALVLFNCNFNITNANGIFSDNTSVGSGIELYDCTGDITNTRTLFDFAGRTLVISGCNIARGDATTVTTSTYSGPNPGQLLIRNSYITFPITVTNGGTHFFNHTFFNTQTVNTTALTVSNANGVLSYKNVYRSGTATAITINSNISSQNDTIVSTNATAVGGAGIFGYVLLSFQSSNGLATTLTGGANTGQYIGWRTGTVPAAGFIGEQVRSYIPTGSAVVLANGVNANLTSISLTPGVWDVSLNAGFTGSPTGTQAFASISTVSATPNADVGDSGNSTPTMPTAGSNNFINIPQYRMAIATTTTVYAVVRVSFTVGAVSAFGRISAVRVG